MRGQFKCGIIFCFWEKEGKRGGPSAALVALESGPFLCGKMLHEPKAKGRSRTFRNRKSWSSIVSACCFVQYRFEKTNEFI